MIACNERNKLITGGVKVRKDSCIAQKCTGKALSLMLLAVRKWGMRERCGFLEERRSFLYYMEG